MGERGGWGRNGVRRHRTSSLPPWIQVRRGERGGGGGREEGGIGWGEGGGASDDKGEHLRGQSDEGGRVITVAVDPGERGRGRTDRGGGGKVDLFSIGWFLVGERIGRGGREEAEKRENKGKESDRARERERGGGGAHGSRWKGTGWEGSEDGRGSFRKQVPRRSSLIGSFISSLIGRVRPEAARESLSLSFPPPSLEVATPQVVVSPQAPQISLQVSVLSSRARFR